MADNALTQMYDLLFARYGPQHWWPGEDRFEIILGAILTQNTNWTNVEKALANLRAADVLTPERLYAVSVDELAAMIRPAGYFNVKAKRVRNFLVWLHEEYGGDLDALAAQSHHALREQLLGINGVGAETADSILLYAFDKPVFVVDAYTCRVLGRHRMLEPDAGYEQVREMLESLLPTDVPLFNEFHALFVRVGKDYCRPRPRCNGCPLESMPHDVEEVW